MEIKVKLPESGCRIARVLYDIELQLITQALERARGRGYQARAARLLGLNRTTLVMKLIKYGLLEKPQAQEQSE